VTEGVDEQREEAGLVVAACGEAFERGAALALFDSLVVSAASRRRRTLKNAASTRTAM